MFKDIHFVEEINEKIDLDYVGLIEETEKKYEETICKIAGQICDSYDNHCIVLMAGPSGSGKTTTARMIVEQLKSLGRDSLTISLDDFYKNRDEYPIREDGLIDYESVHALDIQLMTDTLNDIILKGKAEIPQYIFSEGKRSEILRPIKLDKGDIAVVEGIHALNPIITEKLPQEYVIKIYVNLASRVFSREKANFILQRRDMRLIRRILRDKRFRGTSPERTLEMWHTVIDGEFKYLFPYQDKADIQVDSFHLYEPSIYKDEAIQVLSSISRDNNHYDYILKLINSFKDFRSVDRRIVPKFSLLREFLGNDIDFNME